MFGSDADCDKIIDDATRRLKQEEVPIISQKEGGIIMSLEQEIKVLRAENARSTQKDLEVLYLLETAPDDLSEDELGALLPH